VDGGRTSLTSPSFDVTGMTDPTFGYWRWLYASGGSDDWLAVLISNDGGASWVAVDTTFGYDNHWEEGAIRISDYVTPTSQMRVRFVAADLTPPSLVEAAIDDFTLYDGAIPNVDVPRTPPAHGLRLGAPRPNPARGTVRFTLELPNAGVARVDVLDLGGRLVRTLHSGAAAAGSLPLKWDGSLEGGRTAPAGLYFVRATSGVERAEARFVLVR
jgi:hypothetical protein